MSEIVKITSITANTPVAIYYCDSLSASCVFVTSASTFPFEFTVPDPYDTTDFTIKVIDSEGCEKINTIYITPTPTIASTPNSSPTPTLTPTNSSTPLVTFSQTPTLTQTPSNTTTNTPSVTPSMTVIGHFVGQFSYSEPTNICCMKMTILQYYTYISEANTIPVIGAAVYTFTYNGVLYNPLNGNNLYYKLQFGSNFYAVQIDLNGIITNFDLCI